MIKQPKPCLQSCRENKFVWLRYNLDPDYKQIWHCQTRKQFLGRFTLPDLSFLRWRLKISRSSGQQRAVYRGPLSEGSVLLNKAGGEAGQYGPGIHIGPSEASPLQLKFILEGIFENIQSGSKHISNLMNYSSAMMKRFQMTESGLKLLPRQIELSQIWEKREFQFRPLLSFNNCPVLEFLCFNFLVFNRVVWI